MLREKVLALRHHYRASAAMTETGHDRAVQLMRLADRGHSPADIFETSTDCAYLTEIEQTT